MAPPGVVSALLTLTAVLPVVVRTGTTVDPERRTVTTRIGVLALPLWRRRIASVAKSGAASLSHSERVVGRTSLTYYDIHVPTADGAAESAAHVGGLLDLEVDRTLR